jgi:hypothetical protein
MKTNLEKWSKGLALQTTISLHLPVETWFHAFSHLGSMWTQMVLSRAVGPLGKESPPTHSVPPSQVWVRYWREESLPCQELNPFHSHSVCSLVTILTVPPDKIHNLQLFKFFLWFATAFMKTNMHFCAYLWAQLTTYLSQQEVFWTNVVKKNEMCILHSVDFIHMSYSFHDKQIGCYAHTSNFHIPIYLIFNVVN